MKKHADRYIIGNLDFYTVRNRNELRVLDMMRTVLNEMGNPGLSNKALMDAYAFALNKLPARYAQQGTIILREPVKPSQIRNAVEEALGKVLKHPKA